MKTRLTRDPAPSDSIYQRYLREAGSGASTERTSFFSDAVFAVAMTLLAVELHAPADAADHLVDALTHLAPEILAYLLSFAVVGAYWLTHHRYFRLVGVYTVALQRINLLLLAVVVLVPFATSLLGEYGDQGSAVVVYAGVVAGLGGVQVWLWEYARSRRLFREGVDEGVLVYLRTKSLVVPAVFLASIPVALTFGALTAELFWGLILPAEFVVRRSFSRRGSR